VGVADAGVADAEAAGAAATDAAAARESGAESPRQTAAGNGEGGSGGAVAFAADEGGGDEARSAVESADPHDEERRQRAIDLVVETLEALVAERGDNDVIWGSMVKQTLKRRQPGFNESYHGYRSFNALLEDAASRGLLCITRDEKSGGFKIRLPERVE
jgi:hypothetical protein